MVCCLLFVVGAVCSVLNLSVVCVVRSLLFVVCWFAVFAVCC